MGRDGDALRVMSFNILCATGDLHVAPWDARKALVAETIRTFDPDLLGTQELLDFQAAYLRRVLPDYGFTGRGRVAGDRRGMHAAVFWRRDRFEKLADGTFWLSKTPDVPGSRDWFCLRPRIATWLKLASRRVPRTVLYLFNTHFDLLSWHARQRSAALLRRRIGTIARGAPTIVTGDFNTRAGRRTYRALLAGPVGGPRLLDSYREVHPEPQGAEGTWHGWGLNVRRRIDWILHTPHLEARAAGIDRGTEDGRFPSDHHPVWAVLEMKRGSPWPR